MANFYRVKAQSEVIAVPSQKAEGGQISKCNIVLQELGGKYENSYVATILGEQARTRFELNDLVAASHGSLPVSITGKFIRISW